MEKSPATDKSLGDSREHLRRAMLGKTASPPVQDDTAAAGVGTRIPAPLKPTQLSSDALIDFAANHRTTLVAGGITMVVLITRPWRMLLKPKVFLALAVPLAGYGLKQVPPRIWMQLSTKLVAMAARKAKLRRQAKKVKKARLSDPAA